MKKSISLFLSLTLLLLSCFTAFPAMATSNVKEASQTKAVTEVSGPCTHNGSDTEAKIENDSIVITYTCCGKEVSVPIPEAYTNSDDYPFISVIFNAKEEPTVYGSKYFVKNGAGTDSVITCIQSKSLSAYAPVVLLRQDYTCVNDTYFANTALIPGAAPTVILGGNTIYNSSVAFNFVECYVRGGADWGNNNPDVFNLTKKWTFKDGTFDITAASSALVKLSAQKISSIAGFEFLFDNITFENVSSPLVTKGTTTNLNNLGKEMPFNFIFRTCSASKAPSYTGNLLDITTQTYGNYAVFTVTCEHCYDGNDDLICNFCDFEREAPPVVSDVITSLVKTYPGYVKKAITFSFDDGDIAKDSVLISYLNKYALKATFNIITNKLTEDLSNITPAELTKIEQYLTTYYGHELANHSNTHPWMHAPTTAHPENYTLEMCKAEFETAQQILKYVTGIDNIGGAWPYGEPGSRDFYPELLNYMAEELGLQYMRYSSVSGSFSLPKNFMEWQMSCHQDDMIALSDDFINLSVADEELAAFSIWGHAYEMYSTYLPDEAKLRFEDLDAALSLFADKSIYWSATNKELCLYAKAMDQAIINREAGMIYNPSGIDLYFIVNGEKIMVPAGYTANLSGEEHTHAYDQEKIAEIYIKDAASCAAPAVYYKSCVCGMASESETFLGTELDALKHFGTIIEEPSDIGILTKYSCCGKVKKIVTEYGTIPEIYADVNNYPFAVFCDGEFVNSFKYWSANAAAAESTDMNVKYPHMMSWLWFYRAKYQDKNVDVVLLRDYTADINDADGDGIVDSDNYNFAHFAFASLNIDLCGNTIDTKTASFFYIDLKDDTAASQVMNVNVKNGTVKTETFMLNIYASNNKQYDLGVNYKFTDIIFDASKQLVRTAPNVATNAPANRELYQINVTFEACEMTSATASWYIKTNEKISVTVHCVHRFDGELDDACNFCGKAFSEVISGVNLAVHKDLAVRYHVDKFEIPEGKSAFMKFTLGNKEYTVTSYIEKDGKLVFTFDGIGPHQVGAKIDAELIVGDTVVAGKTQYSVEDYCREALELFAEDTKLVRVISDLMYYAYEAEVYMNVQTKLDLTGITASEYIPADTDNALSVSNTSTVTYVYSVGVHFNSQNKIFFKIYSENEGFAISINGIEATEIDDIGGGYYMVYTDALAPTDYDVVHTVTVSVGNTVVSTVSYTINTYAYNMSADEDVSALTLALYRFGRSCEAYIA